MNTPVSTSSQAPNTTSTLGRLKSRMLLLTLPLLAALCACSTSPPEGISAVKPFDAARYEGKWYEIARLDHSFERGLSNVSANYRAQPDGSIQVINRGYDSARQDWRQATGRALFTGPVDQASLKVSFFGPFYGGYHVVALDQDYRWAMIVGQDRDYMWILARDRQLPADVRERLLAQARSLGLDTNRLMWVEQNRGDG